MASFKSRGRSIVSKPVQRKRHTQRDHSMDDDSDDELFPNDTATNGVAGDHDFVDLQNIADRVGQEVDIFAETLDQFRQKLSKADTRRNAAVKLCTTYRDYALDQVKKLKKQHQVRRLHDNRDIFAKDADNPFMGRATTAASVRPSIEDAGHKTMRQWQQEADTWDLFRVVLKSRFPSADEAEACKTRLSELGQPHKYMTNDQLWQSFIFSDSVAKERHLVLKWLEQTASSDAEIKQLTHPDAEKKPSLWTNGWMETRERIKGAKRMRIGDSNLDIRRSDSAEHLVSSLDPDAPSRQKRILEKPDVLNERNMWIACFDMLRQGKPWPEICAWCTERNQSWKALSMGLAADEGALAGAGVASGTLFRRMCLVAARVAGADAYEAAVYGLLGGDVETVKKACRGWNDHVFAQFNASLLAQYDRFLLGFQSLQLPLEFVRRNELVDVGSGQATLSSKNLISSLAGTHGLAKEAKSAYKLVQGSLIANTFHDLCLRMGAAVADEAFKDEPSVVIKPIRREGAEDLDELAIVRDPDVFRIVTHAMIIMRHLESEAFDQRDEFDNIIAGYIQLLRSVSKADATPVYGSLMAEDRCIASLAQVIADNQDPRDAMQFIKIAEVYNIDAIAIITGQYSYQLDRVLKHTTEGPVSFTMLEATKNELYPTRRITLDGLDTPLTADDRALVTGLAIFHSIDGQWATAFKSLATACRKLLLAGHFATTRAIVEHVQFERLSQGKSVALLGRPVNVMNPEETNAICTSDAQVFELQFMQKEAQAYYDVTMLVQAATALETWRRLEYDYIHLEDRPASVPTKLKRALDDVEACMDILFQGILVEAKDDAEAESNAAIRALYLPELVLGYLTVLSVAGSLITRDALLTAMEIANTVATDETTGLKQAFIDAKRMKELVEMFAQVSKTMLRLNEGGHKKKRKEKGGRSLAIWDVMG